MINIAVIEDEKESLDQINQVLTRFSQENKEEIKIKKSLTHFIASNHFLLN